MLFPTQSPQLTRPGMYAATHEYWVVSSTFRNNASVFEPGTGLVAARIAEPKQTLVHEIDLSYIILPWSSRLRNGAAFREAFGDWVGYRYSESEDRGVFWSNDPNRSIGEMARSLGLLERRPSSRLAPRRAGPPARRPRTLSGAPILRRKSYPLIRDRMMAPPRTSAPGRSTWVTTIEPSRRGSFTVNHLHYWRGEANLLTPRLNDQPRRTALGVRLLSRPARQVTSRPQAWARRMLSARCDSYPRAGVHGPPRPDGGSVSPRRGILRPTRAAWPTRIAGMRLDLMEQGRR